MDLAKLAMDAGENNLLEGVYANHVYQSVMDVFLKEGFGEHFPTMQAMAWAFLIQKRLLLSPVPTKS